MSSLSLSEARQDIMGSAVFRLTLRFAAIFVACLLIFNVGLGLTVRWQVENKAKAQVEEQFGMLLGAFEDAGATGLARLIGEHAGDGHEHDFVYGHQAADGTPLAGDLAIPQLETGWFDYTPERTDEDAALWVKSAQLPDGTWIHVGTDSTTYHHIGQLVLAGTLWTIAVVLPLVLLGGVLLSRAVLQRLAGIAVTVERVREGDLSRRAPLARPSAATRDEFDRLANNINAMLDTIESLTRNLRNVSVGIAHELRSPLARIHNRLVEMKQGNIEPGQSGPAIDGALAEIDATLTTFDALLKIGQIEANAQRKGFEEMRFSDLVTELAEVYQPVATEQGKNLRARVAPDVELRGNRALLKQMISNLVENAIEHTPSGTTITLALEAAAAGNRTLIVQDDGPGIASAESERIFDRFYRIDRSHMTPGNGLGLSLVQSICGLHGFTVRLSPSISGARFEISM